MQQTITTRQYLYDGPEIQYAQDRTLVFLAELNISGQLADTVFCLLGFFQIHTGDGDAAVVLDFNLGARFLGQLADGRTTFANDITDFIGVDRKSTRLNSSHVAISYAVFCLKKNT